jgi:hypothetical protein
MLTGETIQLLEAIDHLVDVRVAAATRKDLDTPDRRVEDDRIREARARLQIALTRVTDKIPWSGR